ncbi:hypothetical protein ODZ83_04260 [Acaricomes phytoseiuli]|uniref:DUF6541 family protein n=1 Tax=Acaricomes phytoseiuli TaxID=291968 RepID=UPI000364526B|nr:DUF6541 family protein [Acaricomes phytoseiuli]MCW1249407.1 hypothetical protein [Acaricomes phytoseiuli]
MEWFQLLFSLPALILVYFIPGLVILWCAGIRGLNLLLAAPVSITLISGSAIVLGFVNLPFTPAAVAIITVITAVLVLLTRWLWSFRVLSAGEKQSASTAFKSLAQPSNLLITRSLPPTKKIQWAQFIAISGTFIAVALIIAANYATSIGSPQAISQTFDNIYHLNAVKYIVDTGNGSSLTIGNLTEASRGFYPAGFHDGAALFVQLSGQSVNAALNFVNIFTAAVIWPLSCAFMISRFCGPQTRYLTITLALAGGFSAFPYLSMTWGVLYPIHAALAILPVALGLAAEFIGVTQERYRSWRGSLLGLCAVVPGLTLTHPSALMALLVLTTPMLFYRLFQALAIRSKALSVKWVVITGIYLVILTGAWLTLRPDLGGAPWSQIQTDARAVGEILTSAPMGETVSWLLTILLLLGLTVVIRQFRTRWWILGGFLVTAILYVLASGWGSGRLRSLLVGVWYNDPYRLAALLPLASLPIIVLGASAVFSYLYRAVNHILRAPMTRSLRRWTQGEHRARYATLAVFLILLMAGSQFGALNRVKQNIQSSFELSRTSPLLTIDESELLKQIPEIVPPDETIVAAPIQGGSLVYALENRKTIAPHAFGDRDAEETLLLRHWQDAKINPQVCKAIKDEKAYWAIDFPGVPVGEVNENFSGTANLEDQPELGIREVLAVGNAKLFRTTACD